MISYFVFEVSPILHTRTLPCGADRVFQTLYPCDKAREERIQSALTTTPLTSSTFIAVQSKKIIQPRYPIHLTCAQAYVGYHKDIVVYQNNRLCLLNRGFVDDIVFLPPVTEGRPLTKTLKNVRKHLFLCYPNEDQSSVSSLTTSLDSSMVCVQTAPSLSAQTVSSTETGKVTFLSNHR